jgi:hypothetical protein
VIEGVMIMSFRIKHFFSGITKIELRMFVIVIAYFCVPFIEAQVAHGQRARVVEQRGFRMNNPSFPLYEEECSSCHIAYQPAFLPKRSWKKLVDNLEDHFGQDADLESASKIAILRHLQAYAADSPKASAHSKRLIKMIPDEDEPLRITETFFWRRKHGGIKAYVWKRAAIESRSNCIACHKEADKGTFWEKTVKIPKD